MSADKQPKRKTDGHYTFYHWPEGTVTAAYRGVWATGEFKSEDEAREAIALQWNLGPER